MNLIPFAKTQAEHIANSDPRRSRRQAAEAVAQKFLLQKDADAFIAAAKTSTIL